MLGAPDTATLAIGVSTTAPHAAAALARNNDLAAAVQAALARDGVAAKDVQTTGLSLGQNWAGGAPDGYQVNDEVTATLRNLARAGTVIDDALAPAGDAGRLQYLNLSMSDSNPLMAAARQRAVASAQVQAEQIAQAAGLQLGSLVSITSQPVETPTPLYAAAGSAQSISPVPLQAGSQQVSVTVTAVWHTVGG